jgi:transposase
MTDTQWDVVSPVFPDSTAGKRGRPREHSRREILNAILYFAADDCRY